MVLDKIGCAVPIIWNCFCKHILQVKYDIEKGWLRWQGKLGHLVIIGFGDVRL